MDDPRVIICQGPPLCLLTDAEAVAHMQKGCLLCRIELYDDVTDTWEVIQEPGHA